MLWTGFIVFVLHDLVSMMFAHVFVILETITSALWRNFCAFFKVKTRLFASRRLVRKSIKLSLQQIVNCMNQQTSAIAGCYYRVALIIGVYFPIFLID